MVGLRVKSSVAAATLCAWAIVTLAHAQGSDEAVSAAIIPLSQAGPGSLTGVWSNPGPEGHAPVKTADGAPIPYQPSIAKVLAQRRTDVDQEREPGCVPTGMPTMMQPPVGLPLQILESNQSPQVTVLFGYFGAFRVIPMNQKHPHDPDPTYLGNSVGHWEGNTLVVDTIGLTDKTTLFGAPHSEDMHLVERIHRLNKDTLQDRITIDDPKTYAAPWTWVITLKQLPGVRVQEYERRPC